MKDTPTIAEAIQAARESTRIAELDLLRAMNAGTDSGTVAGKLVAQLLDSDVRLITVIGKRVSQIADTLQALEEPSPMAEDMAQYRQMLGRVQHDTPPPEPEPIEPPPFKPSQRCTHVRGDGKRCTRLTWATEEGHEHRFPCAGRVPGTQDTCDGDEGHSGPCFQIPF